MQSPAHTAMRRKLARAEFCASAAVSTAIPCIPAWPQGENMAGLHNPALENPMPAYLYANLQVTDAAAYETYRSEVPALIAAHGGRYLVRGGATEVLEGTGVPQRQVILEFPDMAHLKAFYGSAAYQRLIAIRQGASSGSLFAIEGV